MATKAKAKASRSTYLDIGLRHIGRLEKLAEAPVMKFSKLVAYQSAHDDLAGNSWSSWSGVNRLCGSFRSLGRLLHASDRRLCGGTAVGATASALTAVANEVIQRLVQVVGRHGEES